MLFDRGPAVPVGWRRTSRPTPRFSSWRVGVRGRLAHGETRIDAALHDDWRIRREGRPIFAEAVRFENAAATLDRPAVGARARSRRCCWSIRSP